KTNTLFLSHSPTAVRDISEQNAVYAGRRPGEELAENLVTSIYPPLIPAPDLVGVNSSGNPADTSGFGRSLLGPCLRGDERPKRARPYPASAVSASRTQ